MSKKLTRDQVAARQRKAVSFTENVRDDPDRADEIENMSVDEYAAERGFKMVNPGRRTTIMPKTRAELVQENSELNDYVSELEDRLDQVADLVVGDEDSDEEDDSDEGED
ncbi:MAG: hypothetical protein ACRD19_07300 [Terriglobia bacterium]